MTDYKAMFIFDALTASAANVVLPLVAVMTPLAKSYQDELIITRSA